LISGFVALFVVLIHGFAVVGADLLIPIFSPSFSCNFAQI
jgi:hypothetical protein